MGNSQAASLIDAVASAFSPPTDDINPIIQQSELRPGQPYLSGAHILSTQRPPWERAYVMQGLAMQTTNNMYISAPEANQKSIITHKTQQIVQAAVTGSGSAPTTGIFTGVEDHC